MRHINRPTVVQRRLGVLSGVVAVAVVAIVAAAWFRAGGSREVTVGYAVVPVPADWRVVEVGNDDEYMQLCGNTAPTLVVMLISPPDCPRDPRDGSELAGYDVMVRERASAEAHWILEGESFSQHGVHGFARGDGRRYVFPDLHLVVDLREPSDMAKQVVTTIRAASSQPPADERQPFLAADSRQALLVHEGRPFTVYESDPNDGLGLFGANLRPGSTINDATLVLHSIEMGGGIAQQPLVVAHFDGRTTRTWSTDMANAAGAVQRTRVMAGSLWDAADGHWYLIHVDHASPDFARLRIFGWAEAPGARPPDHAAMTEIAVDADDQWFAPQSVEWDAPGGGQIVLSSWEFVATVPLTRQADGSVSFPPGPLRLQPRPAAE